VIEEDIGVASEESMEEVLVNEEDPIEHDREADISEFDENSDDEGDGSSD